MRTNNSKEKVRQLQNKLYLTAKKCDSRRFHALYDKVYRDDVLFEAWKRLKANKGYYVVDADIEKFFDNVNQDKLMVLIEQRISDQRILKLIRQWLKSGVLYGNILTISELGTSQGSVISPLLANIYLNTLDRLWEKYGLTHGTFVRYADDTVIICKNKKSANHALSLLSHWNRMRNITLA